MVLGSFFVSQHARAASGINPELSYYGVLKSSSGASVADGNYDMVFKIYTDATGGTPVWTGNYTAANGNPVEVKDGNFTVLLGSGNGNALTVDFSQDSYYVGITVGTDNEMSPRQQLAAAPYAFNSNAVNGTSIYKVTGNPENSQAGSVGDMALDTINDKLYIKTSGTLTNTGWSEVVGSGGVTTLSGLTDTNISSPATNNVLVFNSQGQWANQAPGNMTTSTSGMTITGGSGAVLGGGATINIVNADGTHTGLLTSTDWNTFNSKQNALTFSGPLTQNGSTISMNQANGSTNGYLSSTDWNTFNNKQNSLSFGNLSASNSAISITGGTGAVVGGNVTISIANADGSHTGLLTPADYNAFSSKEGALTFSGPLILNSGTASILQAGTASSGYLSAADWNTFYQKQNALSFGNLTVNNPAVTITGGTGAVVASGVTISIANADGTHTGLLTSTDWNTFNSKQSALTFSGPITQNGSTISINQAGGSANGYLSSTDWNTFNGKQNALTFLAGTGIGITNASGQVTINATGTYMPTGTNGQTLYYNGGWTTGYNLYDAGGNIGIGTTNPAYSLQVAGTLGIGSTAYFGSGVGIGGTNPSALLNIATPNGSLLNPLSVSASGLPALAVNSSGLVGLGTSSPGSQLAVAGGAAFGSVYSRYLMPDGNVAIQGNLGIGTTSPGAPLEVNGNMIVDGTGQFKNLVTIGASNPVTLASDGNGNLTASGLIGGALPAGYTQYLFCMGWSNGRPYYCVDSSGSLLHWNGTSYVDYASSSGSSYTFSDSLVNNSGTITLVGDSATPGNNKYYGTDASGNRGFFTLPSASGGEAVSSVTANFTAQGNYTYLVSGTGTVTATLPALSSATQSIQFINQSANELDVKPGTYSDDLPLTLSAWDATSGNTVKCTGLGCTVRMYPDTNTGKWWPSIINGTWADNSTGFLAALSSSPSAGAFGTLASAGTMPLTITNTGNRPTTPGTPTYTTGTHFSTSSNTCTSSLNPNANCTLTVGFDASSSCTSGCSDTVSVPFNDYPGHAATPLAVGLSGTTQASLSWSCTDATLLCDPFDTVYESNNGLASGWTVTAPSGTTINGNNANTTALSCDSSNTDDLLMTVNSTGANSPSVSSNIGPISEEYGSFYFKLNAISSGLSGYSYLIFSNSLQYGEQGPSIDIADNSGTLTFQASHQASGDSVVSDTGPTITTGIWHLVAWHWKQNQGSAGFSVSLDGTPITIANNSTSNYPSESAQLGLADLMGYNYSGGSIEFDAVKISTSAITCN